jgi:K(+)-stimulated pyrophosphate-energized sodium pump
MLDFIRFAPLIGVGGLLLALVVYFYLLRQPTGNDRSRLIARLIEEGAMAFLRRQYAVLLPVLLVVAALLTWTVGWRI